jgi:hypothetical protein
MLKSLLMAVLLLVAPPPQDWKVTVNQLPRGNVIIDLHISGKFIVPGNGYSAKLIKVIPQNNPKILLLELKITEPKEPATEPEDEVGLNYRYPKG